MALTTFSFSSCIFAFCGYRNDMTNVSFWFVLSLSHIHAVIFRSQQLIAHRQDNQRDKLEKFFAFLNEFNKMAWINFILLKFYLKSLSYNVFVSARYSVSVIVGVLPIGFWENDLELKLFWIFWFFYWGQTMCSFAIHR